MLLYEVAYYNYYYYHYFFNNIYFLYILLMDWQEMNQDIFVDFVGVLTDVIEMVSCIVNRYKLLQTYTVAHGININYLQ